VRARDDSLSILLVTAMYPHAERPGNGAFVMHQVEHLRALGHHVTVVHVRGYVSKWAYLGGAIRVLRATWRGRFDVVHVHYGLTGLCALARWRTPMVVTLHGSDVLQGTLQPFVSRVVSKIANATIVVSPEIGERCPGILIPCGVDLDTFRRVDRIYARRELGLSREGRLVLFPFDPGRRVKRFDLAQRAVERLRKRGIDVSLLPVWTAACDRMPLYYSAADVMVLCSESEGSPTSVKEALACNLPVVSTDVGDVRSLLAGIAGTELCEPTEAALATGLERTLDRIETATFESRAAVDRFDQRRTAEALVNVYRTVVQGRTHLATSSNYT
jgi:glycosyltransferase involved in cell wall biosynthesis